MATIVIDPGHGGTKNVGGSDANHAVGPVLGLKEKDLTLKVGLAVEPLLMAAGHKVFMTRNTDTNLSLADRAKLARTTKADCFVSIHFNASDAHNAQGTETFVGIPATARSEMLCRALQPSVVTATGLKDRNAIHGGVKRMGLGVLNVAHHDPGTACVLLEASFMDRADEEGRLATEAYIRRIADGIARGIGNYLGQVPALAPQGLQDAIHAAALTAGSTTRAFLAGRDIEESPLPAAKRRRSSAGNDVGERLDAIVSAPDAQLAVAAAVLTDYEKEFAAFIDTLNLKFFTWREFLVLGGGNTSGGCAGKNSLPPKSMWSNISRTALMLDEIRKRLGSPVRINSVFRSNDYNTCIGGKPGSLHKRFNAIDWQCDAGTTADWHAVAIQVRASNSLFNGGIGHYPGVFVHIDTRGSQADWVGNG